MGRKEDINADDELRKMRNQSFCGTKIFIMCDIPFARDINGFHGLIIQHCEIKCGQSQEKGLLKDKIGGNSRVQTKLPYSQVTIPHFSYSGPSETSQ